jgi:hypothetical protein
MLSQLLTGQASLKSGSAATVEAPAIPKDIVVSYQMENSGSCFMAKYKDASYNFIKEHMVASTAAAFVHPRLHRHLLRQLQTVERANSQRLLREPH